MGVDAEGAADALEDALEDEAADALLSGSDVADVADVDDGLAADPPATTVGTAARLVASGNVASAIAKACT